MKIELPFHSRFTLAIAGGSKVATTRSRRCGRIGDHFFLKDCAGKPTKHRLKIISVSRERLIDIAEFLFWEEGFLSFEKFKEFWLTIHRKWQPEKKFYLHIFRKDEENIFRKENENEAEKLSLV